MSDKTENADQNDSVVSRRDFFKQGTVAGIGAAVGAGAAIAATPSAAFAEITDADDIAWDTEVDVLIAGAGNGGMSAGLAAVDSGANTLILEISTQIGGNTLMSGGVMHTASQRTWEDYNKYTDGMHDQVLGKVYVETFWNEYIPFLQSHNAYMSRPNPDGVGYGSDWHLGHGESGQLRHKLYFDSLVASYEGKGGVIQRKTRVTRLITDKKGAVIGVEARVWSESPTEPDQPFQYIRAQKTIMAIGGWLLDGEKKQTYFGQDGYMTRHFCGPFSSGEGMEMIQKIGGALSQTGWSTFSGTACAVTATPQFSGNADQMLKLWEEEDPEDWGDRYPEGRIEVPFLNVHPQFGGASRAILVNRDGKRFIDESSPVHGKYPRIPQAIIRQPGGYAWLIVDKEIFDKTPGANFLIDKIIAEGGVLGTHGNVIIADTLDELAEALSRAGVYKGAFKNTIEEYNAAVDAGTQEDLPVSHYTGEDSGGYAIRSGPFYAIPTTVNVYIAFGGVRIDADARVLDAQNVVIPNLYAPPPLGGGIQNGVYMGGIASAGTFGYRAARHAVQTLEA